MKLPAASGYRISVLDEVMFGRVDPVERRDDLGELIKHIDLVASQVGGRNGHLEGRWSGDPRGS